MLATMQTLADRLKAARKHAKLTQEELAARVGLRQAAISKLEKGDSVVTTSIVELAQACGVRIPWLRSGRGPMLDAAPVTIDRNGTYPSIPLVRFQLSAGVSGFEVEYLDEEADPIVFRADWFRARRFDPAKLYALRVSGASMEPSLYPDDHVVVNTADQTPVDGEVFAVNYEGECVVKRLVRSGGAWLLSSDNPDKRRFPDKPVHEGVFIIGRIVHRQSERI